MGDEDRDAILGRRQKLIALALAGLASTGCGDSHGPEDASADTMEDSSSPMPCLSMVRPDTDVIDSSVGDAPDATDPFDTGTPMPCLSDAGMADTADAEPEPCLAPPLPDGG